MISICKPVRPKARGGAAFDELFLLLMNPQVQNRSSSTEESGGEFLSIGPVRHQVDVGLGHPEVGVGVGESDVIFIRLILTQLNIRIFMFVPMP